MVGRKSVSTDPVARVKQTGLAGKKLSFLKESDFLPHQDLSQHGITDEHRKRTKFLFSVIPSSVLFKSHLGPGQTGVY